LLFDNMKELSDSWSWCKHLL